MFGFSTQNNYLGFQCIKYILKKTLYVWLGFWQMQNVFCKFTILERKSKSKKLWIMILACDYDFVKAIGTHPAKTLIAPKCIKCTSRKQLPLCL